MRRSVRIGAWALTALAAASVFAAVVPPTSRFDRLVLPDPSAQLGTRAETPDAIPGFDAGREGWNAFRASHGSAWRAWVDRRSGAPLWVEGPGIAWFAAGSAPDAVSLEAAGRRFVAANEKVFGVRASELVLNREGTGSTDPDHSVLVFDRVVGGVPVEDERFVLYVTRGHLTGFGASRWGSIDAVAAPRYGADTSYEVLRAYMGLGATEPAALVEPARKVLVASPVSADAPVDYRGAAGEGLTHRLAWRFAVRVGEDPGTWVGKVDAETGKVIAFYDNDKYGAVKGGVYPVSNDGDCANGGCELSGFPLGDVTVMLGKRSITASDMGTFDCQKGSKSASAYLTGQYVGISDRCGSAVESGNCTGDLDFGASTGTDCVSPQGSTGNTHAARTSYYHLDRMKEKAHYWLPQNNWVTGRLTSNVNITSTCNAYWNGSVNFYRSGGGCRNTGEIAGVVDHEYGHGLDQNDGGGYDNPSEGYADVIALLEDRVSCVGRGFFASGNCSGYGDSCLSCSGIRDMNWDARVRHTPATPANFTATNCGGGGGPCGREVHCESYVPAEAIYDLAARDLPAEGLDTWSAWQLAEKLFYKSRQGSGGNAFNCALPSSDGCGATSWFTKVRNADDDDGNLANGTPHGAAIFAAFNRHAIACGAATDPSNQSASTCASLDQVSGVTVAPGAGQATISWTAVPGASKYLVLRNDIGCDASSVVIAEVNANNATSYTDIELPTGTPVYYRVQAQGSNAACEGAVSACTASAAN